MARSLAVAFWNVQNLFTNGAHPTRGPQSAQELTAKLDSLARVVGQLDNGAPPDILVVAEVAEETLVRALCARLPLLFQTPPPVVFEPPVGPDTGIAVVGLKPSVLKLTRLGAEQRGHRPRALSVSVELAASAPPLYLVGCHWKSNRWMPGQVTTNQRDRRESGCWLGEHLNGSALSAPKGQADPIIVMGDFNTEPYAAEVSGSAALYATRHYKKSLRANRVRLFNCMWPWLVDPGASAIPGQPIHAGPRSLTSFGSTGEPAIYDHVLVSRSVLRGDAFVLGSVDYHRDNDTAQLLPQARHVVPRSWNWDPVAGAASGTSDHFPVVANLLY